MLDLKEELKFKNFNLSPCPRANPRHPEGCELRVGLPEGLRLCLSLVRMLQSYPRASFPPGFPVSFSSNFSLFWRLTFVLRTA